MRKLAYVSGTRADFGLMRCTLAAIQSRPDFELSLLITGMHLLPEYGNTWEEIATGGFRIQARIPVVLAGNSGAEMALALGEQILGFTRALQSDRPDLLVVLGDRGEMLAATIAAIHLNIPVVHLHGGEISGTIDESVRHAISKMAHYHFVATETSRVRLERMGEMPEHIFVVGAPGLDEISAFEPLPKSPLYARYGLNPSEAMLLVVFHPVVQQVEDAARQTEILLEALSEIEIQCLILMPNSDAGGSEIARVISSTTTDDRFATAVHLPRTEYLSLATYAEAIVGNSSSGIIESASLGTPAVNIGVRQRFRERNSNVIDTDIDRQAIVAAIRSAVELKGLTWPNVYGDGNATDRIMTLLAELDLDTAILEKSNAY